MLASTGSRTFVAQQLARYAKKALRSRRKEATMIGGREAEIYCPLCAWRPGAFDRWWCYPGCRTEWNTFWTRGLCPGCGHQWADTACLRCGQMSPHESWYHYPDDRDEPLDDAKIEHEELETA